MEKSFTETIQTTKEINNTAYRILASIDQITEYVKQLALNQEMNLHQIRNILNHRKSIITNPKLSIPKSTIIRT